ncbi:glycerophosphodiester phosphodiesterase domain-containing protein 4 isoform X2 [Artibeus jamaicensis]|uniref:glycerophosphodiester phosphodiesterase domain-containing protein 4 isoform X2 n=1 Tax=Artibeus jamaicensis TaxID=9417 RepID=UPI00235A54F9|nr:glycerophosphodiester phosphodiesterase domain-containing protein 4 isoform X2 [Artibeus jamaicensis]
MQNKNKRKTRRWKNCSSCIADHCNHECYITYITGLYSLEWEIKPEKRSRRALCCCSLRERLFYPFLVIAFCISVVLLLVWIETSNEYHGFDWVVYLITRYWFFWSLLLLSLFGILAAYTALLLVLGFLLIWEGYELYLHWSHKILTMLVIGICTFFMTLLFKFWNDRWLTLGLSLKIFAPYIHLSSITVMVLLSWPVAFYLVHWELEAVQVAIGLPFFLILFCLFVVPLGIYSPCLQEKDELGPKPGLIGHRGAPMLGPENTMMSFEKAVENGAFALESDVYLSYDGVPFLMHDYDLRRTTNIGEIMPNASNTTTNLFYWDFLSTLNAGRWFVQSRLKPFHNMEPLSEADREKARNQKIPKLADLLELAQKERKFVIFDLNSPPINHPFRNTFIQQVVRVILDSKIEQHLIYWLPNSERNYVKLEAPGFQQVGRLTPIEVLTRENISIINVDYKKLFYNGLKDYKEANITINLYIVNEPWLFSLAWCSRIHSVTTDNVQLLRQMHVPYYLMTPGYYVFMWLLLDIVSFIFIVAIFYFHWWRESQKEKVFETTSSHTDGESISLKERKSEKGETLNVPLDPASQVRAGPRTPAAPSAGLTGPRKKDSEPSLVQETTKPLMPTDNFTQRMPTQAPAYEVNTEATVQPAVPDSK